MGSVTKHTRGHSSRRAFTLIEILVVIGIIAILATIVIVAINPSRQFAQARQSQRISNINSILNAIGQRIADNKGIFAGGAGSCPIIGTTTPLIIDAGSTTLASHVDLASNCLVPTYISSLPFDPSATTASSTEYTVNADNSGRITVCAPYASKETALASSSELCVTR